MEQTSRSSARTPGASTPTPTELFISMSLQGVNWQGTCLLGRVPSPAHSSCCLPRVTRGSCDSTPIHSGAEEGQQGNERQPTVNGGLALVLLGSKTLTNEAN